MLIGPSPHCPQSHLASGGRIVCGTVDGSVGDGISYVCWCKKKKIVKRRMRDEDGVGKGFLYMYLSMYFSIRFYLRDEDNRYVMYIGSCRKRERWECVLDLFTQKKGWREMWCLGFGNWWCEMVELKEVWAKEKRKVGALALILMSFDVFLKDEALKKMTEPSNKKKMPHFFFARGGEGEWGGWGDEAKSLGFFFPFLSQEFWKQIGCMYLRQTPPSPSALFQNWKRKKNECSSIDA